MEHLRYEQRGRVGWLTLHRPERLNAFTHAMWAEMRALGARLVAEREVGALVVIGAGRSFSSGVDLAVLSEATAMERSPAEVALETQEAYTWLEEAPFPTVAAVRGACIGGGLELALACDLRVVARGARLALPEVRMGFVPDMGGCIRLPRVVGAAAAKDLIWTGRELGAEEAGRLGLADRVVDDGDLERVAGALADELAGLPPLAVGQAKHLVDGSFTGTVRDGLRATAAALEACLRSADCAEAVQARARDLGVAPG
ncbi:MAG: enoyl-CoA hydratase/isomerase family protein [Acidimicrobiia bacterium]|nr:enoyl-CoA hydratase/isomerase family protein [Acidimicrobiia bacterium]